MANSIFTLLTVTGVVVGAATLYVTNKASAQQRQIQNRGITVTAGSNRRFTRPRQFRGYGVNGTRFTGYGVPRSIRYNRGYAVMSPYSPLVETRGSGLNLLTRASKGGPKIIRVSNQMKRLAEERAVRRAQLRGSDAVFDYAQNLPDASLKQRNDDVIYADD